MTEIESCLEKPNDAYVRLRTKAQRQGEQGAGGGAGGGATGTTTHLTNFLLFRISVLQELRSLAC